MIPTMPFTGTSQTLQPGFIEMHRQCLGWLSATALWKRELKFFQHLLDDFAQRFAGVDDKKEMAHFQNLILYYQGEVIDELRRKLRDHESRLAKALQRINESGLDYQEAHGTLTTELSAFENQYQELKNNFFGFIETGFHQ
ncbi:MAG TPA: hypothetical protein VIH22_18400 [Cyclobacteriaceae bacterium]|jgi:chromosome segregation ATPase